MRSTIILLALFFTPHLVSAQTTDLSPKTAGACCVPQDGEQSACVHTSAKRCDNLGGSFQGARVSCKTNPCQAPTTGACCTYSGLG